MNPFIPFSMPSGIPPTLVPITGRPQAIASINTTGGPPASVCEEEQKYLQIDNIREYSDGAYLPSKYNRFSNTIILETLLYNLSFLGPVPYQSLI